MSNYTKHRMKRRDGSTMKARIAPGYESLLPELKRLPEAYDMTGEEIFHSRNTIRIIELSGTPMAVKRFKRLSLWRRMVYTWFRPSKARRAFDYCYAYTTRGIATPAPVACVEIYRNGLLDDAYMLSLKSEGKQAFEALVKTENFDPALAKGVTDMMLTMHRKGIIHGDPNLKNFLYTANPDGTYTIETIDINRSHEVVGMNYQVIVDNMARLTHRRDLMEVMARHYAEGAGYDPAKFVADVNHAIGRIERGRSVRHKLKKAVGR